MEKEEMDENLVRVRREAAEAYLGRGFEVARSLLVERATKDGSFLVALAHAGLHWAMSIQHRKPSSTLGGIQQVGEKKLEREYLGSTEAKEVVEEALFSCLEKEGIDPYVSWAWGYEMGMSEPHQWEAGVLCGYWLSVLEEHEKTQAIFERARRQVERLGVVKDVGVNEYPIDDQERESLVSLVGVELRGEKWFIEFSPRISYDHRAENQDF